MMFDLREFISIRDVSAEPDPPMHWSMDGGNMIVELVADLRLANGAEREVFERWANYLNAMSLDGQDLHMHQLASPRRTKNLTRKNALASWFISFLMH